MEAMKGLRVESSIGTLIFTLIFVAAEFKTGTCRYLQFFIVRSWKVFFLAGAVVTGIDMYEYALYIYRMTKEDKKKV